MPVAYYEFAETSKNPITKLAYFKLSERIAKLIGVLAKIHQHSKLVRVNHPPAPSFEESANENALRIKTRLPGFCLMLALAAVFLAVAIRRRRK